MNSDRTRDPAPEASNRDERESSPAAPESGERPVFQHPQWMVGVVLVFAVVAIIAGFDNPVWWIIGFPCILVLVVYVWVRVRGPA